MDMINGIKTRRSVRAFTDEAVSAEVIASVVDTAAFAPSWKNSQTTRYTAILNKEIKDKLASDCMLGFEYNTNTVNGAPCVIVVSTVNGRSGYERDGSFTTDKGTHWQSFDAGIATQTFCLAAHEAGLGTVIMGIFDANRVAELISLPEGQSVSALIALGHPAVNPDAPKRKTSTELLTIK